MTKPETKNDGKFIPIILGLSRVLIENLKALKASGNVSLINQFYPDAESAKKICLELLENLIKVCSRAEVDKIDTQT